MNTQKSQAKNFLGLPKLPAKYAYIVLPFLLSIMMTSIVSCVSTMLAIGTPSNFPVIWLSAWAMSWLIAFPTTLIVLPFVRRATASLVKMA